jgi:hypothetical protein
VRGATQREAPIAAFAAVEVFALVLWLAIGRREWFYHDDWDPLATRKAGDLGDLFRPHNGHWITLPTLMYRFFFTAFGLRAYMPYRIVVLVAYLATAALLLVVMRRAGTNPWIATAAASLFALFGTGWANIIRPFQITFVSSLALGLVYLILVDHDGPFDRRDAIGLAVGFVSLLTSGVAVVMVGVVGIAVLFRRGWRLAALHVTPLAVCFIVWLLAIGHQGGVTRSTAPGDIVSFVTEGFREAFGALGPAAWFGALFTAVLVVGVALAVRQRRESGELAQLVVPLALLAGTIVFLTLSATGGRANTGAADARQSRYVSLVVAMLLPALAIAVDALVRRWRWLLSVGLVLLLAGIPHNIRAAQSAQKPLNAIYDRTKRVMLTVANDKQASTVPKTLRPEPAAAHQVTVGWLVDGAAQHRIPAPHKPLTLFDHIWAQFLISFYQDGSAGPHTHCTALTKPLVLRPKKGDELGVFGGQLVLTPATNARLNPQLLLDPANGSSVRILRDFDYPVRIEAFQKTDVPRVCTSRVRLGRTP